jgi:hypothetical protein
LTFLLLRHGERVLLVLGREPGGEGRRGVDEVVVPVGSGGVVGFDFEERLSDEAGEGRGVRNKRQRQVGSDRWTTVLSERRKRSMSEGRG